MNQKEYLIKILEQLESTRSLARWLRILVEQWHLDNNLINTLIDAVQWAVHTAKTELDKQKLQKSLNALQRMKQMEEESKKREENEINELDQMIENL